MMIKTTDACFYSYFFRGIIRDFVHFFIHFMLNPKKTSSAEFGGNQFVSTSVRSSLTSYAPTSVASFLRSHPCIFFDAQPSRSILKNIPRLYRISFASFFSPRLPFFAKASSEVCFAPVHRMFKCALFTPGNEVLFFSVFFSRYFWHCIFDSFAVRRVLLCSSECLRPTHPPVVSQWNVKGSETRIRNHPPHPSPMNLGVNFLP